MWVNCPGDSVNGGVGHAHRKILQRCSLQRCKALFQVPSSVNYPSFQLSIPPTPRLIVQVSSGVSLLSVMFYI